jgi:hypothetical protein
LVWFSRQLLHQGTATQLKKGSIKITTDFFSVYFREFIKQAKENRKIKIKKPHYQIIVLSLTMT